MLIFYLFLYLLILPLVYVLGKEILNLFVKKDTFSMTEKVFFSLGLGFGAIGLIIFFIGKLNLLYPWIIWILVGFFIVLNYKKIFCVYKIYPKRVYLAIKSLYLSFKNSPFLVKLIFIFLIGYVAIAFLLSMSPEIEFDSLWYHLEIPKIYLLEHGIIYFPSPAWLSPASVMPRLMELNFTFLMSFGGGGILPKFFTFTCLIISAAVLYEFFKKENLQKFIWIPIVLLFNSQGIQWLSSTAYIDFGSLMYGSLAFYSFYYWIKEKNKNFYWIFMLFLGLALATKLWNLTLLPIFVVLMLMNKKYKEIMYLIFLPILIASPFFIEAFYYTHNPIYPVLSISDVDHLSGAKNIKDWIFHVHPKNFINIIYKDYLIQAMLIVFAPLALLSKSIWKKYWIVIVFSAFYLILWSYIPVHEFRYGLAGLISLLILVGFGFKIAVNYSKITRSFVWFFLIVFLLFNISEYIYESKELLIPKITKNSRQNYLAKTLANNMWDFYDSTGYFTKNITPSDKVLVLVHNMYYIDFNYYDMTRLQEDFDKINNEEELLKYLKVKQFTYLLFRGPYTIDQFAKMFGNVEFSPNWIKNHFVLQIHFSEGPTSLYKIIY